MPFLLPRSAPIKSRFCERYWVYFFAFFSLWPVALQINLSAWARFYGIPEEKYNLAMAVILIAMLVFSYIYSYIVGCLGLRYNQTVIVAVFGFVAIVAGCTMVPILKGEVKKVKKFSIECESASFVDLDECVTNSINGRVNMDLSNTFFFKVGRNKCPTVYFGLLYSFNDNNRI